MDIDSSYSNYINALTENTSAAAGTSKLSETLGSTGKASSDDELMNACRQFESYFVEQMFKEMEKTVPSDDDEKSGSNSQLLSYYKDSLIQKYAAESTEQNSLGIAQMLYEQMKRNYGITDNTDNTENIENTETAADESSKV